MVERKTWCTLRSEFGTAPPHVPTRGASFSSAPCGFLFLESPRASWNTLEPLRDVLQYWSDRCNSSTRYFDGRYAELNEASGWSLWAHSTSDRADYLHELLNYMDSMFEGQSALSSGIPAGKTWAM